MQFTTQTDSKHYRFLDYVNKSRWESYYHQLEETLKLSPKKILIIGVGDNIIVNLLKKIGLIVYTFDLDPDLLPDYCGSVTDLNKIIKNLKVDVIVCCQVMEHLPFQYFGPTLENFSHHCKYLILSLPYSYIQILKLSFKIEKVKERIVNFRMPLFWKIPKFNYSDQHYWEIGLKGYSKKKIRKEISKHFGIIKDFYPKGNPYHFFFICKSLNEK